MGNNPGPGLFTYTERREQEGEGREREKKEERRKGGKVPGVKKRGTRAGSLQTEGGGAMMDLRAKMNRMRR